MASGAALPVAAHVVGEAFVKQYYTVLHGSPENAHRFYTDASRLTRAESGPDGSVDTVVAQHDIHNKLMSQAYPDLKAEIKTIDCQESLTGGVLVMVTGAFSTKANTKRNFVQSFFLAPQENGFYVLNDIFRYLDEEPEIIQKPYIPVEAVRDVVESLEKVIISKSEPEELASHPAETEDHVDDEHFEVPEVTRASEVEVDQVVENEISPPPPDDMAPNLTPTVEEIETPLAESVPPTQEEAQDQAPKKSYASILLLKTEKSGPQGTAIPNAVPKETSVNVERTTASVQTGLTENVATSTQDLPDEGGDVEHEGSVGGDGRSIYIKNLSLEITSAELHDEFVRFGPIKPNGINVRCQKPQNFCYAFLEFEDVTAAQSAIDASPITMGDRTIHIQEKRPGSSRAFRGRFPTGRGDRPYRADGRGRSYFGGRGQGRAPDSFFRGRGSGTIRGGYNGSQNMNFAGRVPLNTSDEFTRGENQGFNKPQRRGGGNQMPRTGSRGGPAAPPS